MPQLPSDDRVVSADVDPSEDLVRKGRDIERRVLSEAVRLHLENRVQTTGSKTIVFRS